MSSGGGMRGGLYAGPIKIGSSTIVTLVATTWTAVTLQSLTRNPRPFPTQRWQVQASSTIYIAQGNGSLNQAGAVVALPTNPATATSGTAAGNFELLASTYMFFDVERAGESVLWLFGPSGGEVVRITKVSGTPYDEA